MLFRFMLDVKSLDQHSITILAKTPVNLSPIGPTFCFLNVVYTAISRTFSMICLLLSGSGSLWNIHISYWSLAALGWSRSCPAPTSSCSSLFHLFYYFLSCQGSRQELCPDCGFLTPTWLPDRDQVGQDLCLELLSGLCQGQV